jgi:DNA gyrase subunit A
MKFKHKDDQVVDAELITVDTPQILLITSSGLGKRVDHESFRMQNRGGMGLMDYKTEKAGDVVALLQVQSGDELVAFTKGGQSIRCETDGVKETGRAARGVKIMDLAADDCIVSVSLIREV